MLMVYILITISNQYSVINTKEDARIGGRTPLHVAVINGHNEIVCALLESGGDPEIQDKSGFSSLHLAVRYKRFHIVQTLILVGGADVNSRDRFGNNPAFWAKDLGMEMNENVTRILGPPRMPSIEERFLSIRAARAKMGISLSNLANVSLTMAPTYKAAAKKKGKMKKSKK